ncbi:MAG: hypothetical protein IIT44_06180, partial [Erysipelotrichaceae bacterium]|nr:hypothetical protein [Erysipelotrichaceae bacterium]
NLRRNYYSREIIEDSLKRTEIFKCNEDELPILCEFARLQEKTAAAYYEYQTVKLIRKNKKAIYKDIKAMEKLLTKKPEKAQAIADDYHEKILPLMARIRENTDALEKVTDRKIWPMPTYSDLLFGKD